MIDQWLDDNWTDKEMSQSIVLYCIVYNLYPGFYSYTEGATWKILDLLTETLLI